MAHSLKKKAIWNFLFLKMGNWEVNKIRIIYSWFRASWLYINKIQRDATVFRCLFTAKLLYMFRVSIAPIIRSTSNCKCSFWYRCSVRATTFRQRGLIRPCWWKAVALTRDMTCTRSCSYILMYSWWSVWYTPETCRVNKYLHTLVSHWILLIYNYIYFTMKVMSGNVVLVKSFLFLISNFRRVLNVVCLLLGNSAASEFFMPTFRNTLSVKYS